MIIIWYKLPNMVVVYLSIASALTIAAVSFGILSFTHPGILGVISIAFALVAVLFFVLAFRKARKRDYTQDNGTPILPHNKKNKD